MADGSFFVLIPLLLTCVFHSADNRLVTQVVTSRGDSLVDQVLSKFPITLPEGIDPKNVNITTIHIKTCDGMKEQLTLLNQRLQQATLRNSQLDGEAFGLRGEVRMLKVQLATCNSAASAITGSYQSQLQIKMKQLLDTFDSEAFLILKTMALTREVKSLQEKVKLDANSTESAAEIMELQRVLQEKINELNEKRQQIERSHTNSTFILQIISLQNKIWDVQQEESRRGETGVQSERRIQVLQEELNKKISLLQGSGNTSSAIMLELMFVQSKITIMQRMIRVHIEQYRVRTADIQRQWRQKVELLKKKIQQLAHDENNSELTREILRLQSEADHLASLIVNSKKTTDPQLKELRAILEQVKKRQVVLQQRLEDGDYVQAQLIMKIITIMEEVREQYQTRPTGQATTLGALLQTKEREYAKAQTEIIDLQRRLRLKTKECSGREGTYEDVKTEFEQKIAELNRTEEYKEAIILIVINLHDELKALREQISSSTDPRKISALQKEVETKQNELNARTEDIERQIPNPRTILTIIELLDEMWDLQNKASNGSRIGDVEELQDRLDGLLSEIESRDGEYTGEMLKILILQSHVEYLQRLLSKQPTHAAQLTNKLANAKEELQKHVTELNAKNRTNSRLILTVTDLYNQLRGLEREKPGDKLSTSLTITHLRQQLEAKSMEHSRSLAEIQTLQKKLQLKAKECSGLEERYEQVKTEFEQKLAELNKTGDRNAALIMNVINLHDELVALTNEISTSKDTDRISELQKQLAKKQEELNSKTEDIERLIPNPNIITITELQKEILVLQNEDTNGTAGSRIIELQSRLDNLISELDAPGDENILLMLKILTLQSQKKHLQRLLSNSQMLLSNRLKQLTEDLTSKKQELEMYISKLKEKKESNAQLILTITNLQVRLRELEEEKKTEGQTNSATISSLREQLVTKVEEHARDQVVIQALQEKLNQTDAQCSDFEQEIKALQSNLDDKMEELQSKSDTITSLTLQISTLNVQLGELKKQLQNTVSKSKVVELQNLLDEKNKELEQKTQALKERSAQAQRFLQIIAIQTEIEKLVSVAANDSDYNKITALQAHLNYLISGIQDEKDENTKLMFTVLAQRDEIATLQKQENSQLKADQEKIKDLENKLDDIRSEIKDKTRMLDSRDMRIANLTAQIMELHGKIRPLEDEISDLKETYAENFAEIQGRLNLTKKQLQDSELQLKGADAKNFNLIMEIADLRAQLKKAQKQAARAAGKNISDLEKQLKAQQTENRKLESSTKDLKQEVKELKMCCTDVNSQCQDLQSQLQQSQGDAGRLQQQLRDKDAALKRLQEEFVEQTRENNKLQHEYSNLERQLQQTMDNNDTQLQLHDKDARINQLKQALQNQTRENNQLQDDYNDLLNEKNRLEESIKDLQQKQSDVDDKTIHATRVTFDPDTAHPRVTLTAGNTEISTSDYIEATPDSPGRFDVSLAVLGTTGYSSGKHYWEVSVAGKTCYHVGMASESAPRKGSLRFNPTNGFWTILLNKQGQYKALDRRPVTIKILTHPVTLGILLDYKNGEVSFYDASARSHLYSFRDQKFTDKIYPFINYCVEEVGNPRPLVVLLPGSADWIQ